MNPFFCNYFFRVSRDLTCTGNDGEAQPNPTQPNTHKRWHFLATLICANAQVTTERSKKSLFLSFSVEDPPSIINDVLFGQHTHTYVSRRKIQKKPKTKQENHIILFAFPTHFRGLPFSLQQYNSHTACFPSNKRKEKKNASKRYIFFSFPSGSSPWAYLSSSLRQSLKLTSALTHPRVASYATKASMTHHRLRIRLVLRRTRACTVAAMMLVSGDP